MKKACHWICGDLAVHRIAKLTRLVCFIMLGLAGVSIAEERTPEFSVMTTPNDSGAAFSYAVIETTAPIARSRFRSSEVDGFDRQAETGARLVLVDRWDNLTWDKMSSRQRSLWRTLGYSKRTWNSRSSSDDPPASRRTWSNLTSRQRAAAAALGYNRRTWDR